MKIPTREEICERLLRQGEANDFVKEFDFVQELAFGVNIQNGWWEERNRISSLCAEAGIEYDHHLAIELLGLVGTEISEAIEAARKHARSTWGDHATKDTMVRECAGAIVRLMDLCGRFELPLGQAILAEIEANSQRGHMHGGKKA